MKKIIMLAVWLVPAFALAQSVPGVMSYQGRLLDTNGNPVTGAPSVTFAIYAAGTGGSALWTETQTVQLTNGFYALQLGSTTAFTPAVFDGSARWLGVKVGSDPEMTPRQYIATVPYAFRALNATNATNATSATNATNATNVTSGGTVTTGSVSATSLSVTGNATISGNVTVSGTPLRIPGLVVGGYVTGANCGQSGCTYSCGTVWGDGGCASSTSQYGNCSAGSRPAGYVRATSHLISPIGGSSTGTFLCIQ